MKKALVVILIILLAAGVAVALTRESNSNNTGQASTQTSPAEQAPAGNQSTSPSANIAATITYSDSGFSPASITVKSGDTVQLKNNSSRPIQFSSNPHPTHTDDPDLNLDVLAPGQNVTFVVNQKGTYGYHDHIDASQGGSITIQ